MKAKEANTARWQRYSALIGFAAVALPFVAYSIYRTGYEVQQLLEVRVITLAFAAFTVATVAVLFVIQRRCQPLHSAFGGVVAAAVFAASHATQPYPLDYKLWIYLVAPRLVFAALLAVFSFVLFTHVYPNDRNA